MERFLPSRGASGYGVLSNIFKRHLQSNGFEGQVQLKHNFFASKIVPKHRQSPVLFIHGLLASRRTYHSFVKRKDFVPDREVYTIDLRNHGESPHAQRMDIPTLASDVLAFLDGQGLEQISLVGHSLGGKVTYRRCAKWIRRKTDSGVKETALSRATWLSWAGSRYP
uniref:AB hydrolase-1 domain-containing protein n=1 Tax=Rhodosorus marinus TaxID=101924 RepID=A0A7S0G0X4_9RHOD|mmetsp:Transcript_12125/g.17574  ORF Transcript_12125/g.17574 Transcript_12125/m.17574 type:complete len:167 (+) Transcript_12125:107-607(+)